MFFAATANENFVDLTGKLETWHWLVLGGAIMAMLAIDLFRHREAHAPTTREAAMESAVWVGCGLAFSAFVAWQFGADAFGEYISAYLIEKSLSVDNVFVWAMIFGAMAIPLKYQHRVLFWGIFGALVLRFIFILGGTALLRYKWVLVFFGFFLIYTGAKIIRHKDDEGENTSTRGLGILKKFIPVTDEMDGQRFFTVIDGTRMATPLLGALVVVEFTDVIFAIDSVPAVLAVSNDLYIVFASNAFAILGLRAMYFLLASAKDRFHYLSHGLGAILVFVGIKMTITPWYHVNTYLSLAIIVTLLGAAVLFSEKRARELGITGQDSMQDH